MKPTLVCWLTLSALLVAARGPVWAQEQPAAQDPAKAAVTKLIDDMVAATNAKDAEAFGKLTHDAMIAVIGGTDAAMINDKQELIGPTGIPAGLPEAMTIKVDDIRIEADVAFIRGTVRLGAEAAPVIAAAIQEQGAWKMIFSAFFPPAPALVAAAQTAAKPIWDDIQADGDTGMQAALSYLGDNPTVFVLGLGQRIMVISGRQEIQRQVGGWPAPANVSTVGEKLEIFGANCAAVIFDSKITNQGQERTLHNLVVVANTADGWKVVAFVVSFLPLQPAPA